MALAFLNESMSADEQCLILKQEYIKLQKREQKGLKLIKQYQQENDKMEKTNKLGIKLIENLRKQIEKYQNEDIKIIINKEEYGQNQEEEEDEEELNKWKSRYETEKRTSQYLRAECEDLQIEVEELKKQNDGSINNKNNNNNDDDDDSKQQKILSLINQVWEEEVTALIEQYNDTQNINNLKSEMKQQFNKTKDEILLSSSTSNNISNNNYINYKLLYEQVVESKLKLVQETSQEIQKLRKIIYNQNTTLYKSLFDRIVRYHNLEGGDEDTIFQLITDAQLKSNKN